MRTNSCMKVLLMLQKRGEISRGAQKEKEGERGGKREYPEPFSDV